MCISVLVMSILVTRLPTVSVGRLKSSSANLYMCISVLVMSILVISINSAGGDRGHWGPYDVTAATTTVRARRHARGHMHGRAIPCVRASVDPCVDMRAGMCGAMGAAARVHAGAKTKQAF